LVDRARRAARPTSGAGSAHPRLVPPQHRREGLPGRVHRQHRPSVGDRGLDLAAVTHDARVRQESLDVAGTEAGDGLGDETAERAAERVALAKDGEPREPALEAFEAQLLEDGDVVDYRHAPLL